MITVLADPVSESLTGVSVRDALALAGWSGRSYLEFLTRALSSVRPNFETDRYRQAYREQAIDRAWFTSLLASNLYMEGYSAGRLQQYAGVVGDVSLANDLIRHANDEAHHSRLFLDLIFLVFPDLDTVDFRRQAEANVVDLGTISPCPADYPTPGSEELLNSLVLMNLFEIKALHLVRYLKPFIRAYVPAKHAREAIGIVDSIARDECHHIAYTAKHIESFIADVGKDAITELMTGFIEQMNLVDEFHV